MVIWADPAKSDLRAIYDFIASDSGNKWGQVFCFSVAKQ
jgi:plasmid stabilization system protein ParE